MIYKWLSCYFLVGATMYEFQVGRLCLNIPFWTYARLGIMPRLWWAGHDYD